MACIERSSISSRLSSWGASSSFMLNPCRVGCLRRQVYAALVRSSCARGCYEPSDLLMVRVKSPALTHEAGLFCSSQGENLAFPAFAFCCGRSRLIGGLPHRGLRRRPKLLHLGLHGLNLRAHKLRLDLRGLLQVLGPHEPLGIVQRRPDILLRSRQGPLSHVLRPGLNFFGCLLHGLGRAPGGLQEALEGLARLCDAPLGHVAHLFGNLEVHPSPVLGISGHGLTSLEWRSFRADPGRSGPVSSRMERTRDCSEKINCCSALWP